MSLTGIISGVSGAMGLYSGVKGLFGSAKAAREQRRLMDEAKAAESAWYQRNYYGDYLNNSMARAAMKRVERTLSSRNRENRAYAAVNGATPELALARNRQGMQAMENVVTNLAAQDSENKLRVDAAHKQAMSDLRNRKLTSLSADEQAAARSAASGFNLLNNALLGVNWGKEK